MGERARIFEVRDGGEVFAFAGLDAESVLAHHRAEYGEGEPTDAEVEGPLPDDREWIIADEDGSANWRGTSAAAIEHFVGRDLNPGEVLPLWSTYV